MLVYVNVIFVNVYICFFGYFLYLLVDYDDWDVMVVFKDNSVMIGKLVYVMMLKDCG